VFLTELRKLLRLRLDGKLLETLLARSTMAHYIPPGSRLLALQQPAILSMFRFFMLHVRETFAYQPTAYGGRVTLFKCTQPRGRSGRDPTLGWGMLAADGVDVHDMPGEHLTLLRDPHVRTLAERLHGCLEEARHRHTR
jgi:thioesterase domain-containing protein